MERGSVFVCDAEADGSHAGMLSVALRESGLSTRSTLSEGCCALVCVDSDSWGTRPLRSSTLAALAARGDEADLIPVVVSSGKFPTDLPDVLWQRQALVVSNVGNQTSVMEAVNAIRRHREATREDCDFVFLSYAADDREHVGQFNRDLRRAGVRTWFDRLNLQPGMLWQDTLRHALERATTLAVCLGNGGLSEWQAHELDVVVKGSNAPACNIVYVVLPSADGTGWRPNPGCTVWSWTPRSSLAGFPAFDAVVN